MSKIDDLIQQYCPDGVEYRPIWSLTAWDKKFNGIDKSKQKKVIKYNYLLAADLKSYQVENGTVKLLTTNISNLYTTEELAEDLASDGEVVAIPWGGNPIVQYYKGRFLTADNRIATSLDTTLLNNKFLYYCMLSQMKLIASFYRGSGIKHPEMAKVLDLEIPVPPLPVQEEIVRILDNFTNLAAELQAELQARQQQYNYYRDALLNVECRIKNVEWLPIPKFAELKAGKAIKSEELGEKKDDEHRYPCFGGNGIRGYIGRMSHSGDYAIIGRQGALCGCVNWASGDFYATEHAVVCKPLGKVISRYVYYLFATANLNQYKSQGAQPGLSVQRLNELTFPIPSLAEQQRIVSILDRFDALTNDLTQGLPAEIEARQQQYEYYRERLLTFPKCRM